MSKYYETLKSETSLSRKIGAGIIAPQRFHILSAIIISQCAVIQDLIQQIIYTSHGDELFSARKSLKKFPNPKARMDFLCEFPYKTPDHIVNSVFYYARHLFIDIYELRNILAHEIWSSSDHHPGRIIFSTLDENSHLLMAQGRLWHKEDTTPEETYNATIRYIRSCKSINISNLESAIKDAELCTWCLMNIRGILEEDDEIKKDEARQAFLVYRGTSHLFANTPTSSETVEFSSSRGKTRGGSGTD